MNIVCVICSELLIPSDDVFYTPCGHIFHFVCLTQWLERSKSCPQCREKTTSHKIHRIYFNFSNYDTVEDTCSLQDKLDKLNFQLLLKQNDLKQYTEKSETLEKQNAGLKKEVQSLEAELRAKKSAIDAFKDQIKYFKQQNLAAENTKQEVEKLQKQIENYKHIQTLLEESTEHVDEIISKAPEPSALITYISVMKREMTVSLNKRKELRCKLRSLQQELTKVTTERNLLSEEQVKRIKLEEDLMVCENEKMMLQNKVKELENEIQLAKKRNNFYRKKLDILSCDGNLCGNSEQKNVQTVANDKLNKKDDASLEDEKRKGDGSPMTVTTNESNLPYLALKSGGVFVLKNSFQKRGKTSSIHLTSSIFAKKSKTEHINEQLRENVITYDGLGGHSKHDQFPNPSLRTKKVTSDLNKYKT